MRVIEDALCEAGHFGQKTGKGYFRYEAGSRAPIPDPEVERIILDASARLGIARRKIEPEEIVERTIFPMINEGARILEEGIAARPGDIDVIWVYGYGWPVWRGGPMYYADRIGLGASARPAGALCRAVRRREPAAGGADIPPCRRRARLRQPVNRELRHGSALHPRRDRLSRRGAGVFPRQSAREHPRPSWSRASISPRTTSSPGSAS